MQPKDLRFLRLIFGKEAVLEVLYAFTQLYKAYVV
jgi:hypothetical protein